MTTPLRGAGLRPASAGKRLQARSGAASLRASELRATDERHDDGAGFLIRALE